MSLATTGSPQIMALHQRIGLPFGHRRENEEVTGRVRDRQHLPGSPRKRKRSDKPVPPSSTSCWSKSGVPGPTNIACSVGISTMASSSARKSVG